MIACAIVTNPNAASNPYGPPVANFDPAAGDVSQYTSIDFTDLSTNTPTSWSWKINGAEFAITQNSSYYFVSPGYFDISLTATNAYGSDTKTSQFHVLNDGGGGIPP